jgi:hypothetical protein
MQSNLEFLVILCCIIYCIIVVRPSHVQFKLELKEILVNTICKKQDEILMVDDLINILQDKFPGQVSGFGRSNVLTAISKLYGKQVEYMGKKK